MGIFVNLVAATVNGVIGGVHRYIFLIDLWVELAVEFGLVPSVACPCLYLSLRSNSDEGVAS